MKNNNSVLKFYFPQTEKTFTVFAVTFSSEERVTQEHLSRLAWLLNPHTKTYVDTPNLYYDSTLIYVGPNLRFETPESEKLRAICHSFGLTHVERIEKFTGHKKNGMLIPFDTMQESIYTTIPNDLILRVPPVATRKIDLIKGGLSLFAQVNKELGLGMDEFDMKYYLDIFVKKYKRNPTDVELLQIAQGNSSHSRHWEFGGKFIIDGNVMDKTLFELVKQTLVDNPLGSIKAFNDNGGVLKGSLTEVFVVGPDGRYRTKIVLLHHTATAETHNHPTLISPYPGAATGIGGRMRDITAIGEGSIIAFGGVYFQTGKLWLSGTEDWLYPKTMATPAQVLRGAILGATSWGNPFGEPTLLFGNDALGFVLPEGERFETVKPIIYTAGIGHIEASQVEKGEPVPGMHIVRIGGSTMRIGVGGGSASSMNAGDNKSDLDFASVQRGEAMIGRSAYKVIKYCHDLGVDTPIYAIHDQGAGGASNVLTELVNPCGGTIDMAHMRIVDPSLSQAEAWIAEAQQIYGLLIKPEDLDRFKKICLKYQCPIEVLGMTNDSGRIVVTDSRDESIPVDLGLPEILGKLPQKTYTDTTVRYAFAPLKLPNFTIMGHLENVARVTGVALLDYMVDHFDGSVGGQVVQGPRCGEYQLPICPYGIISNGFTGFGGTLSTFVRSNPVGMLIDEKATVRMLVAQMLMQLSLVPLDQGIEHVKARLNVMWPFKKPGMKARLYRAYKELTKILSSVGIGIDGGKDSLSMQVTTEACTATSLPTCTLLAYTGIGDFRKRITPDIKNQGNTEIILIELTEADMCLGATALAEAYGQTGDSISDADPVQALKLFHLMQQFILEGKLLAASPKMKGGLLPTLAKMSVASQVEVSVTPKKKFGYKSFYFNEGIGLIIQCDKTDTAYLLDQAKTAGFSAELIGRVVANKQYFCFESQTRFSPFASDIRDLFLETSKKIKHKLLGIPNEVLDTEYKVRQHYHLTFDPDKKARRVKSKKTFKVAVLAAPGTNGSDELGHMFSRKEGFEVYAVEMEELLTGHYDLKDFHVVLFAGGFSYGDVGGSGKGWAASILFNEKLKKMFDDFFARPDALSFGVCNGFQVATLLGILDASLGEAPRLCHNKSGIFEHRLVSLRIAENTRSIMFQGMQGSILPAWSAHGEGQVFLPSLNYDWACAQGLVPLQYVDAKGRPTEAYGPNPNGSPLGIAGFCTKNGQHTFTMPHPERVSASNDHLPYKPAGWDFQTPVWQKAIDNMYHWLSKNAK